MANKFDDSKTMQRQSQVMAILDYYQLIATYRLTRLARNYGIEVYEMLEGHKLYNKVVECFNINTLDYEKTNVELLIQLENSLSSLSTGTSLSPLVTNKFANVSWIDYAIDCVNMDWTAKETLDNYSKRITELYTTPAIKKANINEDEKCSELVKSILTSSKKFKKI